MISSIAINRQFSLRAYCKWCVDKNRSKISILRVPEICPVGDEFSVFGEFSVDFRNLEKSNYELSVTCFLVSDTKPML